MAPYPADPPELAGIVARLQAGQSVEVDAAATGTPRTYGPGEIDALRRDYWTGYAARHGSVPAVGGEMRGMTWGQAIIISGLIVLAAVLVGPSLVRSMTAGPPAVAASAPAAPAPAATQAPPPPAAVERQPATSGPPVRPPVTRALKVATERLPLRSSCAAESRVVIRAARGELLEPDGGVDRYGWRWVKRDGVRGCVPAYLVAVIN